MSNDQSHEFRVNDLTTAVETLLQKVIDKLKASAPAEKDAGGRLFFPDGIRLTSVKVKVPPAEAELTIAGEKDIKPTDARLDVAVLGVRDRHDRDVDDRGHNDPPWHGEDVITWHNRHRYPVRVTFDNPSPLDYPNPFDITGGRNVNTNILASAHGEYHYHVDRFIHGEFHMMAGDPKIIIQ